MVEEFTHSSHYKIQKKKTLSELIKSSIISLIVVLTLILICTSTLFLLNMSNEAQKGYMLKQIYLQKNELEEENKDLNSELVKATSYKELANKDIMDSMEDVDNPIFLKTKTLTSKK
jgi:hypothetical protein